MSPTHPPIQSTPATTHPFKAHYHGKEDGTPGYLAIESGYVMPSGVISGYEAILPKLAGQPLQDQHHTGELTFINNPPVGDYYMEATGTWHPIGTVGPDTIQQFQPTSAVIMHRDALTLTDPNKRALKICRLESDGRVSQYIKSDIPMEMTRNVTTPVPPIDPPPTEPSSSSSSSSSSSKSTSVSSSSSAAPGYNNAGFVYQVITEVEPLPGTIIPVELRFRNTGDTTWTNPYFQLVSENPALNTTWGVQFVPMSMTTPPGVERSFFFNITAPLTPGVYNFQWQMNEGGHGNFGQKSINVPVTVVAAPSSSSGSSSSGPPPPGSGSSSGSSSGPFVPPPSTATHNAAFVYQMGVPEEMTANETTSVAMTFRNTGATAWTVPAFKLQQWPVNYSTWTLLNPPLTVETLPGFERTFTFNIKAPATPGLYEFRYSMWVGGLYFGSASIPKNITVNALPSTSSGSSSSS